MKSLISVLIVLILSASLFAEPFNKGDKVGQIGIGFGHAGVYGDMGFPPISAGLQFGVEKNISVGGIVGFSSSSYGLDEWKWTYSYIFIGARGEYHFLEDSQNMDGYAGVTLGYNIVSVSAPSGYDGYYGVGASYALTGIHVGLRYYFNPQWAVFGELGYGVSYITVGAAIKL